MMNDQLAQVLWAQIWQISLLVIVVAVLARVLARRSSHVAYLLWILVVVKCLTPPLWSSELGVFSWSQWIGNNLVAQQQFAGVLPWGAAQAAGPAYQEQLNIRVPDSLPAAVTPSDASLSSAWAGLGRDLILAGWILGALWCFLASWRNWRQLQARVDESRVPTPAWFVALVENVAVTVQLRRRVRIVVTQHELGPLMMGTWRPTLVIPKRLLNDEVSHRLQPIVAHELVHARRADTLVGWLQAIAQWLWWFHPMVWWANRQATHLCEQSCDDEVIARLNCRPRFYAACLLDLLENRQASRQSDWRLAGARLAGMTRQRLIELAQPRKRRLPRAPVWGWMVVLLTAVVVLPGAERISRADRASETVLDQADRAFSRAAWDEAARLYSRALEEDAEQERAWFRLGYALHVQGKLDGAIEAHKRASQFERLKGVAIYNWSCALALQNDRAAALEKLAEAIEAGFRSPQSIESDPDWSAIREDDEFKRLARLAMGAGAKRSNRQLDFWLGQWRVFDAAGRLVAKSNISSAAAGYALNEAWRSNGGQTGQVTHYYDASDQTWRYLQVDDRGSVLRAAGQWHRDRFSYKGESITADGDQQPCRLNVIPQSDGSIELQVEVSPDQGRNWKVLRSLVYRMDQQNERISL